MIPFFLKEGNAKYFYYQNIYNEEKYFIIFATIGFIISVIVYTWLTFNMISKYRSYIGQHYSFVEGINLLWMKRLLYGIVSLWTVVILIRLLGFYPNLVFFKEGNYLISVAASIFVIFLGFFGIRQTTVFAHHSFHEIIEEVKKTDDFKERYYKSGLKKEQVDLIKNKLIGLMESEKYYLDNKLSLNQLAKHIEINPNYLSQVINEHYSKNFYDFVNSYRIEEFKTKSKDPKFKNYSILALALECGFNSKSAFYSVFKKQLGVSPTEFLKINHNDNNL
jgi:AraC-like DNA-binding protein